MRLRETEARTLQQLETGKQRTNLKRCSSGRLDEKVAAPLPEVPPSQLQPQLYPLGQACLAQLYIAALI